MVTAASFNPDAEREGREERSFNRHGEESMRVDSLLADTARRRNSLSRFDTN